MGFPSDTGIINIDLPMNSPWWDFFEPFPWLSVKEYKWRKKYNWRKIPEKIWLNEWVYDNCGNCRYSSIRLSTGCSWCYVKPDGIEPVGIDEVCDFHVKKKRTDWILWDLCYWHWSEWVKKELKIKIDEDLQNWFVASDKLFNY